MKVSILMNAYNAESYLKEAIDSIYAQTYKNWEIIFIDNCSTDGTENIAKSYDSKLKYYRTDINIPLYSARNFGLKFATGDYLAFLDTDDLWYRDKLDLQVNVVLKTGAKFVYSNYHTLKESNGKIKLRHNHILPHGKVLPDLFEHYCIGLVTILMEIDYLRSNNIEFRDQFQIVGDFDMSIQYAKSCDIAVVQSPTAVYRLHSNNLSFKESDKTFKELIILKDLYSNDPCLIDYQDLLDEKINYLEVKSYILQGKRLIALKKIKNVNKGKFKLFLAALCPPFILKKMV
ncbi:glycosyltransferase family 2 protein [Vibrio lentus]